jgi:hypothetical protein
VVDSLKYLTNLSFDVLGYCIIESLNDPGRERYSKIFSYLLIFYYSKLTLTVLCCRQLAITDGVPVLVSLHKTALGEKRFVITFLSLMKNVGSWVQLTGIAVNGLSSRVASCKIEVAYPSEHRLEPQLEIK